MRMNADAPRWILIHGERVHACKDCRKLPPWPADPAALDLDVEYQPKDARPAPHGTANAARCTSHNRAFRRASKDRARNAYQAKRYGLGPELLAAIEEEQGGRCPCGAQLTKGNTDHNHVLAREHDHPEDRGCPACLRGRLCPHCNREILGYLSRAGRTGNVTRTDAEVAEALFAIGRYLLDPPAQRVLRRMRADVA